MAVPELTINYHKQNQGGHSMKESKFTNYDELPLFLSAKLVALTLGVGRATAYELMNEKDFPAIRVGSRIGTEPLGIGCDRMLEQPVEGEA